MRGLGALLVALLLAGCTATARFVTEHQDDIESLRVKLDAGEATLGPDDDAWSEVAARVLEVLAGVDAVHRGAYDASTLDLLRQGEHVEVTWKEGKGVARWPRYEHDVDPPVRHALVILGDVEAGGFTGQVMTCHETSCGEWSTSAPLDKLRRSAEKAVSPGPA